jgi:phosphoglycolate phosphatase-like HAD superfamily hydrolase
MGRIPAGISGRLTIRPFDARRAVAAGPLMFKNIIWDMDGTLFDTYPAIARAFRLALNDLGRDSPLDQIESLARESMDACIRALAAEHALSGDQIKAGFSAHYAATKPEDEPPFEGVIQVCGHVRRIDGRNVIVTHRSRSGTERLLAGNNMQLYFAGWLTADDRYPRKPDPAAFNAAMQLHHLKPEETLAVGDRDLDIHAGRAAGLFTVRFGAASADAIADLTIQDYSALQRELAPA